MSSLRAFEAAAAHSSFQRAAAELSVTPTAISHQVRGLEAGLGQPLFSRLTRQLVLTPAGLRLFHALREGFDQFEAGIRALRASAGSATVTLSTNTAFAAKWVLPRLAAFRQACPGIELRLHASDTLVDLARGDADLAIRSGRGEWAGLATAELMAERYAPMCSPALGLRHARDLGKHRLIHCDWQPNAQAPAVWPRWFEEAGVPQPRTRTPGTSRTRTRGAASAGLSFSDETHALLAALAGQGVALLSLTLTGAERASGALVQPFGPALETGSYFLAAAKGREREPAIRTVWAWIAAQPGGA
ncbi:LysR substrate-binding domain-containing protein [Variovorax defluvii]|uniref:LysR substrate-binding domain-containing protein n=1 Tax=Variovorax defluvii TaxID=913761 RepID=A0ABP8HH06_9BURK